VSRTCHGFARRITPVGRPSSWSALVVVDAATDPDFVDLRGARAARPDRFTENMEALTSGREPDDLASYTDAIAPGPRLTVYRLLVNAST